MKMVNETRKTTIYDLLSKKQLAKMVEHKISFLPTSDLTSSTMLRVTSANSFGASGINPVVSSE
jgi:hypothetical protein